MKRLDLMVRPAKERDWPAILEIEQRWQRDNVEPLSEKIFRLWMRTHPEGFLVAVDGRGEVCAHAYVECVSFSYGQFKAGESREIFTRPYGSPRHNPDGNSVLVLNIAAVSGSGGGVAALSGVTELARAWGKQRVFYIPRMPGLSAYLQACRSWTQAALPDKKSIAAYYAVNSMRAVGAAVDTAIAARVKDLELPPVEKPDQVLARFIGRELGGELWEIIDSGYSDPLSLDLAALCVKTL